MAPDTAPNGDQDRITDSAAPRCPECCSHGVSLYRWCGWCEDINEGGMDDCIVAPNEPMWLCEHGIGKELGSD